jgi:SEC-C motif-containing protein
MPPMTNKQIEAAPDPATLTSARAMPPPKNHLLDAAALVRRLIDAGEQVPPRLRERILTCGPEVVPLLVAQVKGILTEDGEPNESWAALHALELLVDRRAPEAVAPMIRILQEIEWDTWVHDYVLRVMPQLGAAALEPLLAAHAASDDPDFRTDCCSVLSKLGVRDDRIFQAVVEGMERNPNAGAMYVAQYGDPRALPLLSAALDRFEESRDPNPFANHAVIELEDAIKRLGGTLTPAQQRKVQRIFANDRPKRERLRAYLLGTLGSVGPDASLTRGAPVSETAPIARKIGRNDPCPCGSGKKYKKCCLGKG